MNEKKWDVVVEVSGYPQAEILRGMLEAQEIQVVLSQEGIGRVYGLTVGPLGRVQVLVPSVDLQRAGQIVSDYFTNSVEDESSIDE